MIPGTVAFACASSSTYLSVNSDSSDGQIVDGQDSEQDRHDDGGDKDTEDQDQRRLQHGQEAFDRVFDLAVQYVGQLQRPSCTRPTRSSNARRLRELESRFDLRGVVGSGIDPHVLAEAGARSP